MSGPLPGALHDLTAARIWGIIAELAACSLIELGDKGYLGEDCIRTPYRGKNKPASEEDANGHMPGSAPRASAPTPNSSPGASCASSDAAPGAPDSSPKPSTPSKPAKPEEDEKLDAPAIAAAGQIRGLLMHVQRSRQAWSGRIPPGQIR